MLSKNVTNVMQMPKLHNVNLNSSTGVGKGAVSIDRKQMIGALFTLEFISGQKPSITRAKKSIDKFKLREKMMIGCKVTLRKKKMFFFLDRLINIVLSDHGSSDLMARVSREFCLTAPLAPMKARAGAAIAAPMLPLTLGTQAFKPPSVPRFAIASRGPKGTRRAKSKYGRIGTACAFGISNVHGVFKELTPMAGLTPMATSRVDGMNCDLVAVQATKDTSTSGRQNPYLSTQSTVEAYLTDSFQMPRYAGQHASAPRSAG
jgi:hypothetical protein